MSGILDKAVLFLVGPTASGKTDAAVRVAKKINAEIITADSIQVYRGLTIGSAKPSIEDREGVPHHLIDVAEPDCRDFSVACYKQLAEECIKNVRSRGKIPLVAGGTGLYINSLTYPLAFSPPPADEAVRRELEKTEEASPGWAYRELQRVDEKSAEKLHPNDKKRVLRALEVYRISGKPMSEHGADFANREGKKLPYPVRIVGLTMSRPILYRRIEERVDQMMQAGLLDEVRGFYEKGYTDALPSMQGLGYRQLLKYFSGELTLDEAISAIKLETRHFAKRQMTWFRRDTRIRWIDTTEYPDLDALSEAIITEFKQEDGGDDHGGTA